jgi:hypothetical protein
MVITLREYFIHLIALLVLLGLLVYLTPKVARTISMSLTRETSTFKPSL